MTGVSEGDIVEIVMDVYHVSEPRGEYERVAVQPRYAFPVPVTEELLPSPVTDVSNVPLSAEVNIDSLEYIRIMRRIGIRDGEAVTPVSAFNSSI